MYAYPRSLRGFTFTEAMVVIAITATVSFIGFGWAYRAREHAYAATCASNLHQLGLATTDFYTQKRRMPSFSYAAKDLPDGTFDIYLQANASRATGWERYNPQILLCPKDEQPIEIPIYDRASKQVRDLPVSYAYNLLFISDPDAFAKLNSYSETALLFDGVMDATAGDEADGSGDGQTTDGKNNNGHGNNEDDVDSSNTGKGWRKKGDRIDSDPNVDDENKWVNFPGGVGETVFQGNYTPGTPDFGDAFFVKRHDVNPFKGNVLYADGAVKPHDRTPKGFATWLP